MNDYLFYKFYAKEASEVYVTDKRKSVASYKGYMINRVMNMFHYENLPDTIPQYILEYYILINGSCVISKYHNNLYAFIGTMGGEPDVYYRPTKYIVANPGLKFNKEFDLFTNDSLQTKDCVFFYNDYMWQGLNPLFSRYATLMAENVITLRLSDIMLRVLALLTAPDDKTKVAAEEYLRKIERGELGVIGENRFFDGVKMQSPPSNNGSYLTQFIELQQYYKGSFYNEIGLSAPFNMKRESISEAETTLNDDTLTPLIDVMLECRKSAVSQLNELYNLQVSVDFNSVWKENLKEYKIQMDLIKSEIEKNESEDDVSQLTQDNQNENNVSQLTQESNDTQNDTRNNLDTENEAKDVDTTSSGVDIRDNSDNSGDLQDNITNDSDSMDNSENIPQIDIDINIINNPNEEDVSQLTDGGDEDVEAKEEQD